MSVSRRRLTIIDRALIEARLRDGLSLRAIGRQLGRSVGTVSCEVSRHGGRSCYRAEAAATQATSARRLCGRRARLGADGPLLTEVLDLVRQGWSPEQIAGRRRRIEDDVEQHSGLLVSHEAIYRAIYAMPRGELRREVIACLRQGKTLRGRRPKNSERRGKLVDMTNIRDRPQEVEGRLVPGHWEGDLVLGAGNTAVGTLVERSTRLLLLVLMPTRKAEVAASAFAGALNAIPAPLRRTLTYDQGKEMAKHKDLARDTGMRIFFADPHSPWQRGSNENTNGLLRQYLPKGMSFADLTQDDLDTVAASLNSRPRKTLGFDTPNERFKSLAAEYAKAELTPLSGVRSES